VAQEEASQAIYQFHILLLKISPAIWRRVLVSSDQNLADFHDTLQILMGWDDSHLHRFLIHGRAYGIARDGGLWFRDDPKRIRLSGLHLRIKERFLYEYDFHACWQHQIRLERTLPFDPTQTYPVCIGGARQAPPHWCNGALAYLEQQQSFSIGHIGRRLLEIVEDEEARIGDYQEEAATMLYWLQAETFDRSATNRRLARFAAGEKRW
jgi:Plasmid pRiA4b ORF-3-like protein